MARHTPRKAVQMTGRGFNSNPANAALDAQEKKANHLTVTGVLNRAVEFLKKEQNSASPRRVG